MSKFKNNSKLLQILTFIIPLLIFFYSCNTEFYPKTSKISIYVDKPGKLASIIGEKYIPMITELTLAGKINGSDIRFIRELTGLGYNGEQTNGHLRYLNLAECKIVSGGDSYAYISPNDSHPPLRTLDNIIGEYMFTNTFGGSTSSLQKIVLPKTIKRIENFAFKNCSNLTQVIFPESVEYFGVETFMNCQNLSNIDLPSHAVIILNSAFSKTALKKIKIPDSVNIIDDYSFVNCPFLQTVTLSKSLNTIGKHVFDFCPQLQSIYSPSTTPAEADSTLFTGLSKNNCTLYVPVGSLIKYQKAVGWKSLNHIVETQF